MRSPLIGVIFVLGLFALITPPTLGECPTSFYAEDVTKNDLGSLEFYFTGRSVGSAAECAHFCGKRQFCRTAVYDESASTCAISYGWRTSCSQTPARFNSFTSKTVGLVAVACVDFCPSDDHNGLPGQATNGPLQAAEKTAKTSGTAVSATSPSTSALAAEVPSSAASAQPTTASTAPTPTTAQTAAATTARAPSTDANHVPAAEPTETTTEQSAAPTTASLQLSIHFATAPKSTVTELSTSTSQPTTPSSSASTTASTAPTLTTAQTAAATTARASSTDANHIPAAEPTETTTEQSAAPTTASKQLLIHFRTASKSNVTELSTSTVQPTTPTSSAPTTTTVANETGSPNFSVTNTNKAKVALITAAPESLTTAAQVVLITGVPESLTTAAHLSNSSALLTTTEASATTTSTAAHLSNSSALLTTTEASATTTSTEHTTTTYTGPAFVTEPLLGQSNPSGNDAKSFSPAGLGAESVPCFTFQPRRTLLNAVFATESGISLAECKCLCASSWLSNRYAGRKCRSLQYSTIRKECHLNSADHQDGSLQDVNSDGGYYWFPCYKTEHDVTNYVLNECRGLLPPPVQPNGADTTAPCFEVVNGYLIKGTAGGLEHDVSIEQCQCHCAHSQTSGRYAFQCQSATYYHQERDCVLNLDNRANRTNLFDKNDKAAYTVSYMGMMCSPDRARAQFPTRAAEASNGIDEQVCGKPDGNTLVIRPVTSDIKFTLVTEPSITGIGEVGRGTLIGGSTSSKSVDSVAGTDKHTSAPKGIPLKPGVNSDQCFLELPHYVLEGMALAIESKITVEACKCYCIGAEKRYGGPCQSFQYYYDSKTCLLNRENRISNPDRFNVVPSLHLPHSYFDYRCAANDVVLSVYVDSTCEGLNIDVPIPKSEAIPSFHVQSGSVRYETTLGFGSSRSSGIAFVTAAPGDTEALTPSSTANLVTAATPTASASAAIEGPEIILLVSEIPATLAPVVGISPAASEHFSQNRQRFSNPEVLIPGMEIHRSESSATLAPAPIAFEVKTPPFITAATVATSVLSTEIPSPTTVVTIESTTTTTTTTTTTETPSTEAVTEQHTESSTGRTFQPVGPCRYSAIYETAFQGSKMVDRTLVTSPAQCFSACIEVGCRSANLIQYQGILKHCELFRDSLIDYRTPDVLSFDSGTVYFDGIECSQKI